MSTILKKILKHNARQGTDIKQANIRKGGKVVGNVEYSFNSHGQLDYIKIKGKL